ncbi:CoA-transferase [Spirillospora sp. NPDC127200]
MLTNLTRAVDDTLTLPSGIAPRHLAHAGRMLTWKVRSDRYDRDHRPAGLGPKFVSARRAAELIGDGDTVVVTGFGAFYVPSILLLVLRDRFRETGRPRGLTLCTVTGIGGRGRAHGTIEELALPGLAAIVLMGHVETAPAFLRLADAGEVEMHTLPLGQMMFLLEALGDGASSLAGDLGTGTYLDPRTGSGSPVLPGAAKQFVTVDGDRLRYHMPRPDVLLCNASHADPDGNLYLRAPAMLTELRDAAYAVHACGGKVIACVAEVHDPAPESVQVPADRVDAIVVSDTVSQFHTVPQPRAWSAFTPNAPTDPRRARTDLAVNNLLARAAPRRTPADLALARAAAALADAHLTPGDLVNIGIGLPEEVGRVLYEHFGRRLTLSTEAGVIGGIPAAGMFFGAAVNPTRLVRPAEMFRRYRDELSLTVLGMLEFDGCGNVNVSRRGPKATAYVGPGGFVDIAEHARTVVFVGAFARAERLHLGRTGVTVEEQGSPKLVEHVQEITFNGQAALARGQRVFYATHRALFRLTVRGLELTHVMAGIDVRRDVLSAPGRIVPPEAGIDAVEVLPIG